MITYKRIDEQSAKDLLLPNESFRVFGKMIPSFAEGKWSYSSQALPEEEQFDMVFPDEGYSYESMKDDYVSVGAYSDGGVCVGLAVYKRDFFKYLYLYDLKVNQQFRGAGIGKCLIQEGMKIACENGYRGVYTVGQDNNLAACSFYISCGFEIGGLNTHVYNGTSQEGKSDIYFYKDIR